MRAIHIARRRNVRPQAPEPLLDTAPLGNVAQVEKGAGHVVAAQCVKVGEFDLRRSGISLAQDSPAKRIFGKPQFGMESLPPRTIAVIQGNPFPGIRAV